MRFFRKFVIWLGIILASGVVLLFIASTLLMNRLKPRIERTISETIGFETRIDGRLALKLMPGLSVVAGDLKVISHETYLFSAEEIELAIDYTSLLGRELSLESLVIKGPQAYLLKNAAGIFNYEKLYAQAAPPAGKSGPGGFVLNLEKVVIRDCHLLYMDLKNGDTLEISGVQFDTDELNYSGLFTDISPKEIDLRGNLRINGVRMNRLHMDSLVLTTELNKGLLTVREKRRDFLGGKVVGQATLDFNHHPVKTDLVHQVNGMSATRFLRMVDSDEYLDGNIDYTLNLGFLSLDGEEARGSLNGSVVISGKDLTFYGVDMDKKLEQFVVTSQVDLWELGALFISGPYGPALMNGLDYSGLLDHYDDEETDIEQLHAAWKITDGLAQAEDVALRTSGFRVAATGALDLRNGEYSDFSLSMLDKKGCAVLKQTLNGSFSNPKPASFAIQGVVMKSADDILKGLMASNKGCTPEYRGSVRHPGN